MLGFERRDAAQGLRFLQLHLRDKYLGSAFGAVWAVVNPMLMLGVYTFVFAFVFRARLPGADSSLGYAIWLIAGYGPWLGTTEALMAATSSVVAGSEMVKNMAFKSELLPVAATLGGFVPLLVAMIFVMSLLVATGDPPTWHTLWLLPILAVHALFLVGISLFLSAANVFVRDLAIVLPNLLIVALFATPILYPVSYVPEPLQRTANFNPFFLIADAYRQAVVHHQHPDVLGLACVLALGLALVWLGLHFFRRLRGFFEAAL